MPDYKKLTMETAGRLHSQQHWKHLYYLAEYLYIHCEDKQESEPEQRVDYKSLIYQMLASIDDETLLMKFYTFIAAWLDQT